MTASKHACINRQLLVSFRQKTTIFSALCCSLADAVSYYTIAFDFLSRVSPAERKDLVVNVCAELVDPKIKFTGGGGDGPTLRIQLYVCTHLFIVSVCTYKRAQGANVLSGTNSKACVLSVWFWVLIYAMTWNACYYIC